jgi:hypothetical protein
MKPSTKVAVSRPLLLATRVPSCDHGANKSMFTLERSGVSFAYLAKRNSGVAIDRHLDQCRHW